MEYEAAQERLLQTGEALRKIELAIPVALATFYAWVWSQKLGYTATYQILMWVPVVLVVVSWSRHCAEKEFMRRVASYVSQIESELFAQDSLSLDNGFEAFYRNENVRISGFLFSWTGRTSLRDPFFVFANAYWFILLIGTASIACFAPALWPVEAVPIKPPASQRAESPHATRCSALPIHPTIRPTPLQREYPAAE